VTSSISISGCSVGVTGRPATCAARNRIAATDRGSAIVLLSIRIISPGSRSGNSGALYVRICPFDPNTISPFASRSGTSIKIVPAAHRFSITRVPALTKAASSSAAPIAGNSTAIASSSACTSFAYTCRFGFLPAPDRTPPCRPPSTCASKVVPPKSHATLKIAKIAINHPCQRNQPRAGKLL